MNKLTIIIPTIIRNKELYIQMVVNRINRNLDLFTPESTVKFYAQDIHTDTGYTLKWSTVLYKVYNIDKCIAQYFGMSEQYGDNLQHTIKLISTIQFYNLSGEAFNYINNIVKDINIQFEMKPNHMSDRLHSKFINILEQINKSSTMPVNDDTIDLFTKLIMNRGVSKGIINKPIENIVKEPITIIIPQNNIIKSEIRESNNKLQELELELTELIRLKSVENSKAYNKQINHLRAHIRYYKKVKKNL